MPTTIRNLGRGAIAGVVGLTVLGATAGTAAAIEPVDDPIGIPILGIEPMDDPIGIPILGIEPMDNPVPVWV